MQYFIIHITMSTEELRYRGRPVEANNPLPTNDVTNASNNTAISAETVTFVGKAAAGSTGVVSLDKKPILNKIGDKVGSYWGENKNKVWRTNNKEVENGKITALVETATAATITIESATYDLEALFESATSARFVLRVWDKTGASLYGFIEGIAATDNSYAIDIYNNPVFASGAQSWIGTLSAFDNTDIANAEIYSYESSFVWGTGTVLTREVGYNNTISDIENLKGFSNGDYAIDYGNSRILYKRATTGTSDTASYTTGGSASAPIATGDVNVTQVVGSAVSAKNAAFAEPPLGGGYEYEALGALTADGGTAGDKVPFKGTNDGVQYVLPTDGTNSMPTMDAAARRGYTQPTDGTNVGAIDPANTARTTATVVQATQNVDSAGLVHDLGTGVMAASAPVTIATDDTQFGAVGAASDVDGNVHGQLRYIGEAVDGLEGSIPTPAANFKSPDDFTATYTSTTTITLTGVPFTAESAQVAYIKYIPTGGSGAAVLVNGQNGVTLTISSNVITVDGGGTPFAASDGYEVGINGQKKGYDASYDVDKTIEQSPLNTKTITESLVDTTDVTAATVYYPSATGASFDYYKDLSFSGKWIDADGTVTMTVEAMNDSDTTNGDWIQVYWYDDKNNVTTNSITVTNGTLTFAGSFNNFNFKNYRFKVVFSGSTNTAILKQRKKAL